MPGLVVTIALFGVVVVLAIAAEVSIRRRRAAGKDPITPQMRRWGGHHQLWSAAGAAILGVALVSPLGLDFGRWAWIAGVVLIVLAAVLVVEGLRQLDAAGSGA